MLENKFIQVQCLIIETEKCTNLNNFKSNTETPWIVYNNLIKKLIYFINISYDVPMIINVNICIDHIQKDNIWARFN